MKKRVGILLSFIVLIFLAGAAGSVLIITAPHGQAVQIVQDGNILYTLDLSRQDDRTIQVDYDGGSNSIQIQDGKIRMLEADCPDHVCVRMGWLDSAAPIVCLPNHLVIRFVPSRDFVDATLQ